MAKPEFVPDFLDAEAHCSTDIHNEVFWFFS